MSSGRSRRRPSGHDGRRTGSRFDLELDLHGLCAEDAIRKVEDAIYKEALSSVLLIHGKGDGVLRKTLREHLHGLPCVREVVNGEDFNFPGGAGVTIIYM